MRCEQYHFPTDAVLVEYATPSDPQNNQMRYYFYSVDFFLTANTVT